MSKAGRFKLEWDKSVSPDADKVIVTVSAGGLTISETLPPDQTELIVVIKAQTSYTFSGVVVDTEGNTVTSVTFSGTVGDLENPQPITNLRAGLVEVVDVPDDAPAISFDPPVVPPPA